MRNELLVINLTLASCNVSLKTGCLEGLQVSLHGQTHAHANKETTLNINIFNYQKFVIIYETKAVAIVIERIPITQNIR